MSDIRSQKKLEDMRARLYARSAPGVESARPTLSDTPVEVATDWQIPTTSRPRVEDLRHELSVTTPRESLLVPTESVQEVPTKRSYRVFILITTFVLFTIMAGASATYLYYGGNQISANNISVSLSVPSQIGGGEVLPLQFGITNQNSVPIESVALIVTYPPGTQSADETPRRLTEERLVLDPLGPGEVRNIPTRIILFGEENQEQTITATLEYRIANSNGLFYKELPPSVVRISSSPLVLTSTAIDKVASGQAVTITVAARSNASNPLTNVLISAAFPVGFVFKESSRKPVSGNNMWLIETIPPESEVTFTISGLVEGFINDSMQINFSSGLTQPNDPTTMASILATAASNFVIERPFIRVTPTTEGQPGTTAILPSGETASVKVSIQNTLAETIYDLRVEVVPKGNVISPNLITSDSGFYDSNTRSIRWDVANNQRFAEIKPGEERSISFSITPNETRAQAAFTYDITVFAKRVVDNQSIEQLVGEAVGGARYSTAGDLGSQVERNTIFTDSGVIPPQVGKVTTYTVTLVATAEENGITNALVNTSLPSHVTWLDQVRGDGRIVFNTVSKQLEWVIGDISPSGRAQISFQVSIQPSLSQVGRAVELVRGQVMQARDAYTGAQIRSTARALMTELSSEAGFAVGNGTVQSVE